MFGSFKPHLEAQLADIRGAGTYKRERVITTPQGTTIRVADGKPVLNFCANNYLGLANHPAVAAAAKEALDQWGYGMSVGALHLRHPGHPQATGSQAQRIPRHRGHHPLLARASTPTAACSRRCSATKTPSSPTS